jgi:phage anti-repressor protein
MEDTQMTSVNVFDHISEQPVIDALALIEAGEVSTPYEFWYNRMNFEQQQDFVGSAEFFAKAVSMRFRLMTGGEL